jgi:hypothetical protein
MPDIQAIHALLSSLGPNAMANWAILSSMHGAAPMHHVPPPQLLVIPPPPVIDPWLRQPEQNPLQNWPHDDNEDEGIKRHSKKPRKDSKFLLNIKTNQLTPAQKTTRAELQVRTSEI